MGYFPVRYDSRVVIYEHKMFIFSGTCCAFLSCFGKEIFRHVLSLVSLRMI